MAWTDQQREAIERVIGEKTANGGVCPMCQTNKWTIADGVVNLPLDREIPVKAGTLVVGGPMMPAIPIVCATCGNTVLLNAFILGLGELLGLPARGAPKSDETAPKSDETPTAGKA